MQKSEREQMFIQLKWPQQNKKLYKHTNDKTRGMQPQI